MKQARNIEARHMQGGTDDSRRAFNSDQPHGVPRSIATTRDIEHNANPVVNVLPLWAHDTNLHQFESTTA